jgi:hypothetical protein
MRFRFRQYDLLLAAVVQTWGTRTNVSGSLRCLQAPRIAFQIPGAAPP